jgi:endoglucanase
VHHDSWQWLSAMPANHDAVVAEYTAMWTQIATRFAGYDDKLMFEATNEQTFDGVDHATALNYLRELETVFYNVVRGTGGLNATRPVVLTVWGGSGDQENMDSLKATILGLNDPNIIATIHFYGFWPFSVSNMGYVRFESTSINGIITQFDSAYNTFVADGIPVVIGELGLLAGDRVQHGEMLKYYEYAMSYARMKGMTHMLWDTGGIFDRRTFQWRDPELAAVMFQTLNGRATTADTDTVFIKSGAPVGDAYINLNLNGNGFVSLKDGTTTLSEGDAYKLQGSLLTLKGSYLSQYANGGFGEKAVLTVNVNSGPAWKIHVRYYDTPVQSSVSGTIGGITIPTAFNGDRLATMESRYSDGSNAGPYSWTAFQEYSSHFSPNYGNNTITLTKDFMGSLRSGTVNLAFFFWSGKIVNYTVTTGLRSTAGGPDYVIYGDSLAPGWNNWSSWTTNNLSSTTQVHAGTSAISITPGTWGGFVLQNGGAPIDTSVYHSLVFWIHGGTTGGQTLGLGPIRGSTWGPGSTTLPKPVANTWTKVQIPLSALGVEGSSNITGFYFQDWSGTSEGTFYLDDIALSTSVAPNDFVVTGTVPPASPLTITRSGFTLNRRTNRMVQTVTVSNPTGSAVNGPVYLVIDMLSSNTTLANAAGKTSTVVPTGSPYVVASASGLAAGASVNVALEFTVPAYGTISYTPRTLSNGVAP